MIEFVIPLVLLSAGVLCLIYPRQIGAAFCRLGKASWHASTFGLTDMRWFYPEEKAPKIFRIFGVALILFSIPWGIMAVASVSGPGAFAAMRESRGYLSEHYGSAGSWSLSPQSASSGDGDYLVTYRYGEHSGILRAAWRGDHYTFSEEKKTPNQASEPTAPSGRGSP